MMRDEFMEDKLLEVFWAIKRNSQDYFPEESIWTLQNFLNGYAGKYHEEGLVSQLSKLHQGFLIWLNQFFELKPSSHGAYDIVYSYSKGPVDAFHRYYFLFESFLAAKENDPAAYAVRIPVSNLQRRDFCALLRSLRKRPAMWVGEESFERVCNYLSGRERCMKDLGLEKTDGEEVFDSFKRWIETERLNSGAPRPCYKLIRFQTFSDGSALEYFFELLDQYANLIGRPNLFLEGD